MPDTGSSNGCTVVGKAFPYAAGIPGGSCSGAGERDTLRLNFRREIGYDPIGFCRIARRSRTCPEREPGFDRMCEAETRSRIIDWKRVDLIPDTIRPDGRFVEMTAEVEGASVLVTVRNRTGREIVFGDESDFRLGVFRDGRWMSISYARVVTAVAYPLRPFDTIGRMPHALPYRLYRFEPGRYRIAKEFFFEPDFRRKYVASAEFMLDRWIGCDETGEPEIIIECR